MVFVEEQLDLLLDEMIANYALMSHSFENSKVNSDDDLAEIFNNIDTMSLEEYVRSVPQF
jgi:hypothetical protein